MGFGQIGSVGSGVTGMWKLLHAPPSQLDRCCRSAAASGFTRVRSELIESVGSGVTGVRKLLHALPSQLDRCCRSTAAAPGRLPSTLRRGGDARRAAAPRWVGENTAARHPGEAGLVSGERAVRERSRKRSCCSE